MAEPDDDRDVGRSTSATDSPSGPAFQGSLLPPLGQPLTMEIKGINTDLYKAAVTGDLESVQSFLLASPPPNLESKHGGSLAETALHAAAKNNNLDLVNCLVIAGALLDCRNFLQETPLHIAAQEGHFDIVQYLVQNATNIKHYVNTVDLLERTALHRAAERSNVELVKCLIDAGADIMARNSEEATAPMIATERDECSNILQALLCRIPSTLNGAQEDLLEQTYLHIAAYNNAGNNVEVLLSQGADPTMRDKYGQTPWEIACKKECLDAMSAFASAEMESKRAYLQDNGRNDLGRPPKRGRNDSSSKWCYIPSNTFQWALAAIRDLSKDQPQVERQRYLSHMRQNFVERMEPGNFLNACEPSCHFADEDSGSKSLSLSMPYFRSELFVDLQKRKEIYDKSLSEGWKYCCSATPFPGLAIHVPLTFDEYCKPVLGTAILDERNKDQVVQWYDRRTEQSGRKEEKAPNEKVPESARLLVVQQAWIWKIDDLVVASYFEEAKQRSSFIDWEKPAREYRPAGDQLKRIAKLLSDLITSLDRPISAGLPEPIFNTFEKSIITISDDVNRYIRLSNIDDLSLNQEVEYYHQIGDIREELSMIKSVLVQQEEVWKDFVSNAWPSHWRDGWFTPPREAEESWERGWWRDIARPQVQFPKFYRRIAQLDEDAQRVEDSVSIRLDLKSKHASMKEAHSTAVMSAAVFGFTIVTIIFTPLSFMLALFALPIKQFQDNQISGAYTTNYIGKWTAVGEVVSVFLTVILMWAAIEWGLRDPIAQRAWQGMKSTKLGQWLSNTKTWQLMKRLWRSIRTTTKSESTVEKHGPATATGADAALSKLKDAHRQPRRRDIKRDDVEKGQLDT